MRRRLLLLLPLLVALALIATACGPTKYDKEMGVCEAANARYSVKIVTKRDSYELENNFIPSEFLEACAAIGAEPK